MILQAQAAAAAKVACADAQPHGALASAIHKSVPCRMPALANVIGANMQTTEARPPPRTLFPSLQLS
jgi:hypothetical protein